ncbi:LysE family translocator [Comamonas sp. NoAH]|uniref:LysE family translocator n=1 Tax=Comamonas halotolerans TaxID=3041496 RepID=UPI0024E152FE|nr:LysE family translocator [Comamonas sp. NoAH]
MNSLLAVPNLAVLLPLTMFIFVSSITPGPNNVMLTASGANFGYQRTLPHMLGISVGASVQLLLVGGGLGTVFVQFPQLYTALQYVGAAYLIWLAYKIATSGRANSASACSKPFGFWQAAAFQWVNPKVWLMSVGVVAAYTSAHAYWASLLLGAAVMLVVNFPCISVWTLFGSVIGRWLQSPRALHIFNGVMAGLLLLSLYPLFASVH